MTKEETIKIEMLKELIRNEKHKVTILSQTSAFLYTTEENINWSGFYIKDNDYLYLGPFMGNPACSLIKYGNGVCGTCFKENKTIVVDDVSKFIGHIACDSKSKSEICVPISLNNEFYCLLDIDSPILERFSLSKSYFENVAKVVDEALSKTSD